MITHKLNDKTLEIKMDCGKGNLLSFSHLEKLIALIDHAQSDGQTHGVIITGNGHSFSTGLDFSRNEPIPKSSHWTSSFHALDGLLVRLFQFSKPFVAAINGHSVGAGFLIQLCSDYAIIENNSRIKLGLPELRLGLTIDSVMIHLARHGFTSERVLQYFLYSSELLGPEKALQIGVVDKIAIDQPLLITAREEIARLQSVRSAVFSITKLTLRSETICMMKNSFAANSHFVYENLLTTTERND